MQPLDNARHEAFAQGMASGKTLGQALEAAGYQPNPSAGTRLLKNVKVSERIAFLKQRIADNREEALKAISQKEALTREWVIDNLMKNAMICMGALIKPDNHEAPGANKALELLGKEIGMFVERTENLNSNYTIADKPMSEDDWLEEHADSVH